MSVSPSELEGLSGAIERVSLSNWDPRYVPYLMSVDLAAGGPVQAPCFASGAPSCALTSTWARPATSALGPDGPDEGTEPDVLRDTTMSITEHPTWQPEKFISLRVYDFGECSRTPNLEFGDPVFAAKMAERFIDGLENSRAFREPKLRYMDVMPVFRGPEARFAELIITPANFAELFISAGSSRRLRPLRDIPREYFKDNFHPLDGEYLAVRIEWDAAELENIESTGRLIECVDQSDPRVTITANVDVLILNWDAMVAADQGLMFNEDTRHARGIHDYCNRDPLNDYISVPSAGDWIAWSAADGRAIHFITHPDARPRVRRVYVDSSDVQATYDSDWIIFGDLTRDRIRDGLESSLGNGFQRGLIEESMTLPVPAEYTFDTACRSDTECFIAGLNAQFPDAHDLICTGHGTEPGDDSQGDCVVLAQPERIMLTPAGLAIVTADDLGAAYYNAQVVEDWCHPIELEDPRFDQIGNPDSFAARWGAFKTAARTSGYSRALNSIDRPEVSPAPLPPIRDAL